MKESKINANFHGIILSIVFLLAGGLYSCAAPPEENDRTKPASNPVDMQSKAPNTEHGTIFEKSKPEKTEPEPRKKYTQAPLTMATPFIHAAYEADLEDCSLCHENADPRNPGRIPGTSIDLCLECHEEFEEEINRKFKHVSVDKVTCINCHNPHNSENPYLLHESLPDLCLNCHADIEKVTKQAKVKHDAITTEKKCVNCHNPHSSNVEHLLNQLPFDLCIGCHNKDGLKDQQGIEITNFEALLDENPEQHAPVAVKDCSACHTPHGSDNFRLLVTEYPAKFYSGYDPKNYALCFECHDEEIIAEPRTTIHTQFRDADRNLHYLHVNKPTRGRTCRACHEVHAAKQAHIIREAVPYGKRRWMLKLNYTRTETGGSCEKTCHSKRDYDFTRSEPIIWNKLPTSKSTKEGP